MTKLPALHHSMDGHVKTMATAIAARLAARLAALTPGTPTRLHQD